MFPIVLLLLHELAFFLGGETLISCVKRHLGAQLVKFRGKIERLFKKSGSAPRSFGPSVVI